MKVVIVGASGHGKVAFDALDSMEDIEIIGFIDDNYKQKEKTLLGVPILGDTNFLMDKLSDKVDGVFVAIGDNKIRKRMRETGNTGQPLTPSLRNILKSNSQQGTRSAESPSTWEFLVHHSLLEILFYSLSLR